MNLALAETVSPDLSSAGELVINAAVRGSYTTPDLSGTMELQKREFPLPYEFSNGLTNASAAIAFNGTRATIQSFHAESGGGKVDAAGFMTLANGLIAFRLEAKTREVRVRYPERRQHDIGCGSDAIGDVAEERGFRYGDDPPDLD